MNGGAFNIRNRGAGSYNPDCEEHAERMQEEAERWQQEHPPEYPKPDNRGHYVMAAIYLAITLLVLFWILLGYPVAK